MPEIQELDGTTEQYLEHLNREWEHWYPLYRYAADLQDTAEGDARQNRAKIAVGHGIRRMKDALILAEGELDTFSARRLTRRVLPPGTSPAAAD